MAIKPTKTAAVQGVLLETVTLIRPHTHGGKDYAVGATIDVTQAQQSWLARQGIIATFTQTPSGE